MLLCLVVEDDGYGLQGLHGGNFCVIIKLMHASKCVDYFVALCFLQLARIQRCLLLKSYSNSTKGDII